MPKGQYSRPYTRNVKDKPSSFLRKGARKLAVEQEKLKEQQRISRATFHGLMKRTKQ